ncbi:MAG: DNA polymerase I [Muribaculaceae bacterium]|nr:DNA polymerase I [Muribaculaceae bacterium]
MKKLFLLDAYALIYRAYYAMMRSPRRTTDGLNTSAIFGFSNTLDDILRKENPDYIAVCFDPPGGHTFRHDAYPEYKAQREKQPEDITVAIPYIKELLAAYRIPVVEIEGYEADDVIGTLSRVAEEEGYMTYMMTPDKDYGQLVTDRVLQYRPALGGKGFEVRGPAEVCARYGISSPRQVIDLLALEGDASDNIPGCPGVGEKTAVKLIGEYGSVEEVIANAADIKGALGRKVAAGAEQILFSKFLVTIKTDVPLGGIAIEDFAMREPDNDALRKLYTRLEFRSLLKRLGDDSESAPAAENGQMSLFDMDSATPEEENPTQKIKTSVPPVLIDNAVDLAGFVAGCAGGESAVVFNTDGDGAMTARFFGLAIARHDGVAAYVSLSDFAPERADMTEALRPLFEGSDSVCCHDVKSGMLLLRREGVRWTAPWFSTSVGRYLLNAESGNSLADTAFRYLHIELWDYSLTATERRKQRLESPDEALTPFCEHAEAVRRLAPELRRLIEADGLTGLLRDIELPFIPVLASMEWEGVRIDSRVLAEISGRLHERLAALEEKAAELAGEPFNVASPMQVGEVLFERLKIDPSAKRTKRGAWSTTEEELTKYIKKHPIVEIILDIRGLRKLLTTYVDALPRLVLPRDGKLHSTFNQTVTATGRISSASPNLQNIPIRTDDGRGIRRAFVPDPGCVMLSADYSQIELRLMADMSGDKEMLQAFLDGEDIHRATAAKIFGVPIGEVTDGQRRAAKTANFGIIYGISAFGLSERLGIPRSEAKELIDGYMRTYPGVKQYIEDSITRARELGYVTTQHGRKRYLPDINSRNATVRGFAERNAVNAPLQGTAADIIKIAMIAVDAEIRRLGLRSRMILQVHDELIFNVYPDELAILQPMVERCMMQAHHGRVPLEVSAGAGANWLEAH